MKKLMGIPGEEGYSMPGEFEPHRGCIMIWPKRPGSWNYGAVKAREAFKNVAHAIAESEDVYMLAEPDVAEDARTALGVTGEPRRKRQGPEPGSMCWKWDLTMPGPGTWAPPL